MTTLAPPPTVPASAGEEIPIHFKPARTRADRVFFACLTGASLIVLLAIGAIATFLLTHSIPAIKHAGTKIVTSDHFAPTGGHPSFGMVGILQGTITIAAVALLIALPVSIALALMINEYAPRRTRRTLTSIIDLLAVLPSILYGLWGLKTLSPEIDGPTRWIASHLSFIPLFRVGPGDPIGNSIFVCGIVVGIMVIPICTSVSREVMSQAPRDVCEAALALGGTKWGTITDVILPFARNGIMGGALLGLGRALGETVAVLLILSQSNVVHWQILTPGGGQIPALIAQDFTSLPPLGQSALTLAGLLLFTTILVLNILARQVVMGRPQAVFS
jgi:phosphate transport system permease protein